MNLFSRILTFAALAGSAVPLTADILAPATKPQVAPMNAQEKKNLQFVLKFWREVVYAGHTELVGNYVAVDLIQHKPSVPDGRAGLVSYIEKTTKPMKPIPSKLPKQPVVMAEPDACEDFEEAIEMAIVCEHCVGRAEAIRAISICYKQDWAVEYERRKAMA